MVKVGKCALIALMHKKWTLRVELTKKKTSHCKSQDFLRKRRLKTQAILKARAVLIPLSELEFMCFWNASRDQNSKLI